MTNPLNLKKTKPKHPERYRSAVESIDAARRTVRTVSVVFYLALLVGVISLVSVALLLFSEHK